MPERQKIRHLEARPDAAPRRPRGDRDHLPEELSRAGLVVGTAGNVSVREGDLVAVTPSGVRYAGLTPELVGVHRLDGTAVEAPLAPTSELPLHLAIYAARPEVGAVVHTHSPAATALSTLVDEVPAVHYYVAMFGGPVLVAPYATYGTDELARNVVQRAARSHRAASWATTARSPSARTW